MSELEQASARIDAPREQQPAPAPDIPQPRPAIIDGEPRIGRPTATPAEPTADHAKSEPIADEPKFTRPSADHMSTPAAGAGPGDDAEPRFYRPSLGPPGEHQRPNIPSAPVEGAKEAPQTTGNAASGDGQPRLDRPVIPTQRSDATPPAAIDSEPLGKPHAAHGQPVTPSLRVETHPRGATDERVDGSEPERKTLAANTTRHVDTPTRQAKSGPPADIDPPESLTRRTETTGQLHNQPRELGPPSATGTLTESTDDAPAPKHDVEPASNLDNGQARLSEHAPDSHRHDDGDPASAQPDDRSQLSDLERFVQLQTPINSKYAGEQFPLDEALASKYPEGVRFDSYGFPDFTPYAVHNVQVAMRGNRSYGPDGDFGDANEAAGFARNQRHPGFTWHHHQDRTTMLLVPRDLHDAIRHTGGVSAIKLLGVKTDEQ